MSVIVKAYTSHGLQVTDYFQGIAQLEELLGVTISDTEKAESGTEESESALVYGTNHEYFSWRFDQGWPLYIFSNYRFCDRFEVYPHFVRFALTGQYNLKTYQWRRLISGQELADSPEYRATLGRALAEWNRTRQYITRITNELLGDAIIYLNDGWKGHGIGEEAIWEGKTWEMVSAKLRQVAQPVNYADLEKGLEEYDDRHWFVEEVGG